MLCYTYDYTFELFLEITIMSRSRPASNPISYHKHTNQYYVTRGGKRIYLGSDKERAITKYHRMGMGFEPAQQELSQPVEIRIKELANNRLICVHCLTNCTTRDVDFAASFASR